VFTWSNGWECKGINKKRAWFWWRDLDRAFEVRNVLGVQRGSIWSDQYQKKSKLDSCEIKAIGLKMRLASWYWCVSDWEKMVLDIR